MSGESATRITPGNALRPEDVAERVAGGIKVGEDVGEYALRLGDDALILAQRLGWWISRAPELEEDVALGNIALDLLGHARSFLTYAGSAWGKSEDDLAYWRGELAGPGLAGPPGCGGRGAGRPDRPQRRQQHARRTGSAP